MLIDTHCHLNDETAFPDLEVALDAAQQAGVDQMIVVGVEPESWQRAVGLSTEHSSLYAIVGWHPNYTQAFTSESLKLLRTLLREPKVLALGEIGLDFHWNYAILEQQLTALELQLDIAHELEKPVVFHCREAYDRLLTLLERRAPHPYLFHCWMGSLEDAERAQKLGAMIGVDGPITYRKNDLLRESVRSFGLHRIVLETDSPYLSPEPLRGKPNAPANIPLINRRLAQMFDIDEDEAAARTTANARKFFGIPEAAS